MTSNIGSGYDISASTFSPDGKLFQVEYAFKAVDNSCTCIVLRGRDGVLLAVEKTLPSQLLKRSTNTRISTIDSHIGFASSGFYPDCRSLLTYCAGEAQDYYTQYREKMACKDLAERLSMYVHAHTLYGAFRPFGCSVFLCSWDKDTGPHLYGIDPNGALYGYKGWAVGKNRLAAKTEIEKLNCIDKPVKDLAKEAIRILYTIRDVTEDKHFVIEMSWVSEQTEGQHVMAPEHFVAELEQWVKVKIEESEESE